MNGEELDDVYPLPATPTAVSSNGNNNASTGLNEARSGRPLQSRHRPLVEDPWICTADEDETDIDLLSHPYYSQEYETSITSSLPRSNNIQHQNLHEQIQLLKNQIAQRENERKRKLSPTITSISQPAKTFSIDSTQTTIVTKDESNPTFGSEDISMELSNRDKSQVSIELPANQQIEQISSVGAGEDISEVEESSSDEEKELELSMEDATKFEEEDSLLIEMKQRTETLETQLAQIRKRMEELDREKTNVDMEKLKLKVRADLLRKRLGLSAPGAAKAERPRSRPDFETPYYEDDVKSADMSIDEEDEYYPENDMLSNNQPIARLVYPTASPYVPMPSFATPPIYANNTPPAPFPAPQMHSISPSPATMAPPPPSATKTRLSANRDLSSRPRQQANAHPPPPPPLTPLPPSKLAEQPSAPPPTSRASLEPLDTSDYPAPIDTQMTNLKNYFTHVEELIKIRFSNDQTPELAQEEARIEPTDHISRFVYVDNMLLSVDSIISDNKINDTEKQFPDDRCLDSLLLRVLWLRSEGHIIINENVNNALGNCLRHVPKDIADRVEQPDRWGDGMLMGTKHMLKQIALSFSNVQLLWILFAELSLYCHGATEEFSQDVQFIFDRIPVFDVHWQTMRATAAFPYWEPLRSDFMAKAQWSKTGDEATEYERRSQIATEFMLRILRTKGLRSVLRNIRAADGDYINETTIQPFSLEETQNQVHLTDHDTYILWMAVLYYYVCQQAPKMLCNHWYEGLTRSGEPSWSKPLFTIDWNEIVSQKALTRKERFGVANILLSMLRFFTTKATKDKSKRPLMLATWQTLLNFLTNINCYKRAGTLVLLRSGMDFEFLRPENLDCALTLQSAMGEHQHAVKTISSSLDSLSIEKQLMIVYRAAFLLNLSKDSDQEKLELAAHLLSLPLQTYFDTSAVVLAPGGPRIDFVRRMYMGALKLDPVLAAPTKKKLNSFEFRSATFSWINLMFLTQISLWLYPNDTMQYIFQQQLITTRGSAANALRSEESKRLVTEYANNCLLHSHAISSQL